MMSKSGIRCGLIMVVVLITLLISAAAYADELTVDDTGQNTADTELTDPPEPNPTIAPAELPATEPPATEPPAISIPATEAPTAEPTATAIPTPTPNPATPVPTASELTPASTQPASTPAPTQRPDPAASPPEGIVVTLPPVLPDEPAATPALNSDHISVELNMASKRSARISYIELVNISSGADCEWGIERVSGESVRAELGVNEARAYVDMIASRVGDTSYEVTCLYDGMEYSATIDISVSGVTETVPTQIDGIESCYSADVGEEVIISASNAADFPKGTEWGISASNSQVTIRRNKNGDFRISAAEPGRYMLAITAITPQGRKLNRVTTLTVGERGASTELKFNYSEIDVLLDLNNSTSSSMFFVQLIDSPMYDSAEWSLEYVQGDLDIVEMYLSPGNRGTLMCIVGVMREGSIEYALNCNIAEAEQQASIPVRINVRASNDDINGIMLSRAQYKMHINQALTLSPYGLDSNGDVLDEYPVGSKWSVRQLTNVVELGADDGLLLDINPSSGRTTVMSEVPGSYVVEFGLTLSANRSYYVRTTIEVE